MGSFIPEFIEFIFIFGYIFQNLEVGGADVGYTWVLVPKVPLPPKKTSLLEMVHSRWGPGHRFSIRV